VCVLCVRVCVGPPGVRDRSQGLLDVPYTGSGGGGIVGDGGSGGDGAE
jgi:hypothetical protein